MVLLLGPTWEGALEHADALAKAARAEPEGPARVAAQERALSAYEAFLAAFPKQRRAFAKVHRRRARILADLGRPAAAVAAHDAILDGPSRRKDRAKALYDGALVLERAGDLHAAERRLARLLERYRDVLTMRAKAGLLRGGLLERMSRPREARRAYADVVRRCWDKGKEGIAAYDALALLEIREKRFAAARRWIRDCLRRYEKRATRGDRYGAFLSRELGSMKSPVALAEAEAAERPP